MSISGPLPLRDLSRLLGGDKIRLSHSGVDNSLTARDLVRDDLFKPLPSEGYSRRAFWLAIRLDNHSPARLPRDGSLLQDIHDFARSFGRCCWCCRFDGTGGWRRSQKLRRGRGGHQRRPSAPYSAPEQPQLVPSVPLTTHSVHHRFNDEYEGYPTCLRRGWNVLTSRSDGWSSSRRLAD